MQLLLIVFLAAVLFSTNGASDVDKVLFLTYLSLLYFLVLCIPTESGGRSVLSPLLSILEIKAMRRKLTSEFLSLARGLKVIPATTREIDIQYCPTQGQ